MTTNRTLLRVLERERESFALERARLIDQICNLSGQPWTLPPRPPAEPEPEPVASRYTASPDQFPDY